MAPSLPSPHLISQPAAFRPRLTSPHLSRGTEAARRDRRHLRSKEAEDTIARKRSIDRRVNRRLSGPSPSRADTGHHPNKEDTVDSREAMEVSRAASKAVTVVSRADNQVAMPDSREVVDSKADMEHHREVTADRALFGECSTLRRVPQTRSP